MTKKEINVGVIEAILSLCILLGAGVSAWVTTQESIVRLEERVNASERIHKESVDMMTNTNNQFTDSLHELTEVLQNLSISMAGVNARLSGVEGQLKEIRLKI